MPVRRAGAARSGHVRPAFRCQAPNGNVTIMCREMTDAIPAVFARMVELWNGGDIDPADVYARVADDLLATIRRYRTSFPDLRWEIDRWLVAGDRYILRMHATGTYAGEPFRFEGVELHTVRHDRIVDSDQVWDLGALYAVP